MNGIMKKLLIVNNNMKVGGVQKSLCNLLHGLQGRYDVTLCLFRATGAYMEQLPAGVQVVECKGPVRYLSMSQGECRGLDKLIRGGLALLCKCFGRNKIMKLLLAFTKDVAGEYDCALAYLHNGNIRSFYGGVQEFVLKKVKAGKKVAFLHCDYRNCGGHYPANDRLLEGFDRVAACSEGCRRAFVEALPFLAERCVTVPNFHRYDQIRALAAEKTVAYDPDCIHLLSVARLAHEKGLERGIRALAEAVKAGHRVKLHLVGGGGMEQQLRQLAQELGLQEQVVFYGEQTNPYPYIAAADLFLLTSYHEAAPMVIDEAVCLGLPVLTVRTTSSHEMVSLRHAGWVCDNDQAALNEALLQVLSDPAERKAVAQELRQQTVDNTQAAQGLRSLIEE